MSDYIKINDADIDLLNNMNRLSDSIKDVSSKIETVRKSLLSKKKDAILDIKSKTASGQTSIDVFYQTARKIKEGISTTDEENKLNTYKTILGNYNSQAVKFSSAMVDRINKMDDTSIKNNLLNSVNGYSDSFIDISGNLNIINKNDGISDISSDMAEDNNMSVYDANGLKHFMNSLLKLLDNSNINYKFLAGRRKALDISGNIAYGNAFIEKTGTNTFKTLDSDNRIYWFEGRDSRHYYGEAVDIKPSDGKTFSDLLDTICLNDTITDFMHLYGLCIQYETLTSGAAEGSHFDISTEPGDAQLKWWSIVNKIRLNSSKYTYPQNAASSFYETPVNNNVVTV